MGDPSNRNQAHLVKGGRSTSRVLAPPGGSSSICLGGYGGAAEQFSQYGDRRSSIGHQQKSLPPQQAPRMPARTESRDRDVPGLEGHYQQQRRTGGDDRDDAGYYGGASVSARRGPMAGDDYAAQLRAQIAMKKQIDEDSMDAYDRRSSLRRGNNGADDDDNQSRSQYVNQQTQLRRAADTRHDQAMQAYRSRAESDRERDYRRLQQGDEDEDRHHNLTAKNIRAVASNSGDRDRFPKENQRFSQNSNRGQGQTGGDIAAMLRGEDSSAAHTTKRRVVGDSRRSTFSLGWE